MKQHSRLRSLDIRQLMKQVRQFVIVPCPACQSTRFKKEFIKTGFTFVRCQRCETLFINPRPTAQMLEEYYTMSQSIKYWDSHIYPQSENIRRKEIFAPRAKRVVSLSVKYHPKAQTVVDVGSGFGTFGLELKKLKYFKKVVAVEPSPDLAESSRQKGLEVIQTTIEKADLTGVDVITNFELIEHLFSPRNFIQTCFRALSRQGLLILTIPNIKGFDLLTLGQLSDNIHGPNHLNYFHPQSLRRLVESVGFKILEITTPGKLDVELVRQKILEGKLNLSNQLFLQEVLIDRWQTLGEPFQEFLANNQLSSHLWLVARK